ncbi:hypothetical protein ADL22_05455 [Streptomyces sp. NRRL F-4489]|uniref:DUF6542 domain-containing protein n=1 Tax=Streptomyces sp. NRRL F-4489 TaxID=1609095 RepID=UPI00074835F4|nr:DUF6542 domain-containing protein [Streptomyces sp. NRRL F-4489]KUL52383.1 hypothetical protein ADL22_05455 [Streptomyces sp. NRRL F-4489]
MTGQRTEAPYGYDDPARDPARESRRVPGPRRRGDGAGPSGPSWRAGAPPDRKRGRRAGRAALVALVVAAAGAVAGTALGGRPGWAFAVTAALGAALAAKTCTRAGAWWLISAPPLVVAVATVVCEQVAGTTTVQGKGLATAAVRWAVDGFPAMAAAEAVLIAVLAVRGIRAGRRGGRKRSGRSGGA